jgi:hypothetical protein
MEVATSTSITEFESLKKYQKNQSEKLKKIIKNIDPKNQKFNPIKIPPKPTSTN